MSKYLTLGLVTGALCALVSGTTNAALLSLGPPTCASNVCEGITYTLEEQATANPLTEQFALVITGENSASDTIGGRTGINAIAFNLVSNNPDSPFTGVMLGTLFNGVVTQPDPRFQFVAGGLNSTGCDGSGNFYCFDNTTIPPTPSTLLTGKIVLGWDVTLLPGGSWSNYSTALKIDWVGPNQNNYSLVSADIPINTTCPDCVINPLSPPEVPEPGTLALIGSMLGIFGGIAWYRRRRNPFAA